MSFYNGILNLTNWGGNVILPTLAGLFIAIAIIQLSKGKEYSYAMYGGFMCLMASGLLRAFETFASQRAWNDANLVWAAVASFVDWICNVLLPIYAALQVAAGGLQLAGVTNGFRRCTLGVFPLCGIKSADHLPLSLQISPVRVTPAVKAINAHIHALDHFFRVDELVRIALGRRPGGAAGDAATRGGAEFGLKEGDPSRVCHVCPDFL